MKIAYICADFGIPVSGSKGASIHVRELSGALHGLGHDVAIFTPRAGKDPVPGFEVPVHEIGLEQAEKRVHDLLREDPAAGEPVAKEVRSMLYSTALAHRVAPTLREMRPDAIYERYSLHGTAGVALAHDLDIPLVLEVNAPLSAEQAAHRGLAFAQTARAVERSVLCAADRVIAVSDELKAWMVEIGVAADRVTVLPNGVDVDRFAAGNRSRDAVRADLGLTPEQPVVGFVGTLKAWHGTATLVRAVAALHRESDEPSRAPHLLIVGEGPERAALEALARDEGIADATTFTGAVTHDRMPAHIAAMDIAVAPYDEAPGFYFSPLKLFEYMAAGRPVVAADIGQIAACVRPGETGLLYPPGDVGELAGTIGLLLDDPAWGAVLGRAGQGAVRANHTWAGNARAVAGLIEQARQTPSLQAMAEGVR